MNKILFLSLLISSNVFAGWEKVASTLEDDAIFYVLNESIKKTGIHTRSSWELVNHPNGTSQGYKSVKAHQEYDCKSNKVRMTYASTHSEINGEGKIITVADNIPLKWKDITEGSVATFTRDYICGKK